MTAAAAPAGIAVSRGALTVSGAGAAAATTPTQGATPSATTPTATTPAGSPPTSTPAPTAQTGTNGTATGGGGSSITYSSTGATQPQAETPPPSPPPAKGSNLTPAPPSEFSGYEPWPGDGMPGGDPIDYGQMAARTIVRIEGGAQAITGTIAGVAGVALVAAPSPEPVSKVGGAALVVVAADNVDTGLYKVWYGETRRTRTEILVSQKLQEGWVPPEYADALGKGVNDGIIAFGPAVPGTVMRTPVSAGAAPTAEATAAASTSGQVADALMTGRRGGTVLGEARFTDIQQMLMYEHNVLLWIDREGKVLQESNGALYRAYPNGPSFMYVRPGVTEYELAHESFHMFQHEALGQGYFMSGMEKTAANLIREQYVFDQMIEPSVWNSLTRAEQEHAIGYIRRLGGDTRGMVPRGG